MKESFQLVDAANKSYIDAADVQQMAQDVGTSLSQTRAEALIADTLPSGGNKVFSEDFFRVFAPPDPS